MLSGIDISHHNKNMKDPNCITCFDFVIMKASEGQGFKDRSIKDYTTILKQKKNPLIGFYHFARPEINSDPWSEARNFIEDIINEELASGKVTEVHTRFPPEPNGYLHIGHAKSL